MPETLQSVLKLIVPDEPLVLEYDNRRVELLWPGAGNTDGDVVVWLPRERMLITGDLLVAPIPFAFDSPVSDWIVTLEQLAKAGSLRGTILHDGTVHE